MADKSIMNAKNEEEFVNCLEQLRNQYWNASSIASGSLFNISLEKCKYKIVYTSKASNTSMVLSNVVGYENNEKTPSIKAYEERLSNEMKDWKNAYCRVYYEMKKAQSKHPVIDKSILPSDFLGHLETAPCLQTFLRESYEFRRKAYIFQKIQCEEIVEMIANLHELYERRISLIKANKIAEHLANIKTS